VKYKRKKKEKEWSDMAYNTEKLTRLAALKTLAERIKRDYATKAEVEQKVAEAQEAVQAAVPTKVSQLTNDSKFQNDTQVAAAIQTAIAATGHASFEKVDEVPEAAVAQENVLYLVMNSKTKHYDIYAKIGEKVELLDDTTIDLTGYVQKEDGKGLSANDYTSEEKTKLAGIEAGATKTEASTSNGNIKVNGTEVTVYTEPADVLHGAIATETEIAEMLSEVFGSGDAA
jgi:hypothetical protein